MLFIDFIIYHDIYHDQDFNLPVGLTFQFTMTKIWIYKQAATFQFTTISIYQDQDFNLPAGSGISIYHD